MKKLVVVVPTLNEEKNVRLISRGILAQKTALKGYQLSILFVDSNSKDKTRQIVRELHKKKKNIFLLHLKKPGLGLAIFEGLKYAVEYMNADEIVTMDSDGSHDPVELPQMIRKLQKQDIVIGSRYQKDGRISNWPLHRRILSFVGNTYLQLSLGIRGTTDYTSNYRALKADVMRTMISEHLPLPMDWSFLCVFLLESARQGFRITEHSITFKDRQFGESKLNSLAYSRDLLLLPWQYRMRKSLAQLSFKLSS